MVIRSLGQILCYYLILLGLRHDSTSAAFLPFSHKFSHKIHSQRQRCSELLYRQVPEPRSGSDSPNKPKSNSFFDNSSDEQDDKDVRGSGSLSLPPWLRLVNLWSSISTTENGSSSSSNQTQTSSKRIANVKGDQSLGVTNGESTKRKGGIPDVSVEELLMGGGLSLGDRGARNNVTLGAILENDISIIAKPSSEDESGSVDFLFTNMFQKLGQVNDLMKSVLQQQQQEQLKPERKEISNSLDEALSSFSSKNIMTDSKARIDTVKVTGDQIFDSVTSLLEGFFAETSSTISQLTVQTLVANTTQLLLDGSDNSTSLNFLDDTESGLSLIADLAKEQGVDINVATAQAADLMPTLKYTFDLLQFANDVLNEGYLPKIKKVTKNEAISQSRALFRDFDVKLLSKSSPTVLKAAEMAAISGAIYQSNMMSITHQYGHAVVANGTTSDIAWLVTDSVLQPNNEFNNGNEGKACLVRTITIRGYDATDENVDRERLVTEVCTAKRVPFTNGIDVHGGLLLIAESLYDELIVYIDQISPTHKIALNGHSIGGSLSNILLLLLCKRRGVDFVNTRVTNVFTFGSPPVVGHSDPCHIVSAKALDDGHFCSVLDSFGISGSLVQAYFQPWDPIARLFSKLDALYPLVEDLGDDGLTPWVNGPPRTLRPIFRSILESMEVWPRMRENYEVTGSCQFIHIGVPHLILPEKTRYLTDRLVSVNIAVPPIDAIAQIRSKELFPLLEQAFPLDEFSISYISVAVRSFIHHFHPAYGVAMEDFAFSPKREIDERKR